MLLRGARAAAQLDVLIAGAGPGGMSSALTTHALGRSALVIEARGPVATRARFLWVWPRALTELRKLGVPGIKHESSIAGVENALRGVAHERGVPVRYNAKVTDVVDLGD